MNESMDNYINVSKDEEARGNKYLVHYYLVPGLMAASVLFLCWTLNCEKTTSGILAAISGILALIFSVLFIRK